MTRDIVIDALRMAWFKRHPSKQAGLIFHSDRGSQYASQDFRDVLDGVRHHQLDEPARQLLGQRLQRDAVRVAEGGAAARAALRDPRQAKDETIAWLLWYNRTRLHSTLAYVSPMRFEQDWLAAQPKQANS